MYHFFAYNHAYTYFHPLHYLKFCTFIHKFHFWGRHLTNSSIGKTWNLWPIIFGGKIVAKCLWSIACSLDDQLTRLHLHSLTQLGSRHGTIQLLMVCLTVCSGAVGFSLSFSRASPPPPLHVVPSLQCIGSGTRILCTAGNFVPHCKMEVQSMAYKSLDTLGVLKAENALTTRSPMTLALQHLHSMLHVCFSHLQELWWFFIALQEYWRLTMPWLCKVPRLLRGNACCK